MKAYKNPISTAMSEYREDFHYNKEWWTERMGTGNNNEYLWIQFKNGDNITVQSDYFQLDGNTCLPRFRADEVAYISRYFGDQVETTTAADIVVDTDRIILYRNGVEYFRCEMTEEEFKEMRRQMWKLDGEADSTAWMLDYCRAFATSKMNNNTTTPEPDNTPTTMNANETAAPEVETAPEFSQLSHTATNIVLTAENTGDIYRRYVAPLILSLTGKIKRGITPDRKRLAKSSVMRTIIAASLAELYCAGFFEDNTKVTAAERKEAANYLAWSYISDAEDEYNNQMAAYK